MHLPSAPALDFDRAHDIVAKAIRDRTANVAGWVSGSIGRMIEDVAN